MTRPSFSTAATLRRIACLTLPELPIQMLRHKHPDWREHPVAWIEEERPDAVLLAVDERARAQGIDAGMRFGAAKSLLPGLLAGAVSEQERRALLLDLVKGFQTLTPHVECDLRLDGVFYLDPRGLGPLYGTLDAWAESLRTFVRARGFRSVIVIGWGRASSFAVASVSHGVINTRSARHTLSLAHRVPLSRLLLDTKVSQALSRLGLVTLGDLHDLGADALRLRFGEEAALWCRVAKGEEVFALTREEHREAPCCELEIEPPDSDVARLCFVIKRGLDRTIEETRRRGLSVHAVTLTLKLDHMPPRIERIAPGKPTRDGLLLLELLRLRLSSLELEAAVTSVTVQIDTGDVEAQQLSMFAPKRDPEAGERALARIAAGFGERVVCHAQMRDAHLPEARFAWVRHFGAKRAESPHPSKKKFDRASVVRRVLAKPKRLEASWDVRHGELLLRDGVRLSLEGPRRISGGWWVREVERDYYYSRHPSGQLWWLFFDGRRTAWYLQAVVD